MVELSSGDRHTTCSAPNMTFPEYTAAERRLDGIIHVIGVVGSLIAFVVLLDAAGPDADALTTVSLVVYGLGMIAMFSLSAAYNIVDNPWLKAHLRRLDHAAIFLKIAGTYTPFALVAIGDGVGIALFAMVWAIALVGMPLKLMAPARLERASVWLYLGQGWLVLLAIGPLGAALSLEALALVGIGGVLYTVGVFFHLSEKLRFHNAIWHAFVLAASACMYGAVMNGVALSPAWAAAAQ